MSSGQVMDHEYFEDVGRPKHPPVSASAKTKSPALNLFNLLYPQTQKNEIKVSPECGIALLFQSAPSVVAIQLSSSTTSIPTVANETTST
jgi:hypothetical protein